MSRKKEETKKRKPNKNVKRKAATKPPVSHAGPDTTVAKRKVSDGQAYDEMLARSQNGNQPKRKSRKTQRKQRNRRILLSLVLVFILIATAVFLSLKVLFVVRDVIVTGSERYSDEEIKNFCAIPMEENIFSIDTDRIEQSLPENFTYVESADVSRRLPDKIQIKITDAVPTYYTVQPEGETFIYTVYSSAFKQLTQQAAAPEGLVMIDADLSDEEIKRTVDDLIDILKKGEYNNFTGIIMPSSREIAVVYDGRITVNIGTMSQADYKIKLAWHVIEEELRAEEKGVIDCTSAGSAIFSPLV